MIRRSQPLLFALLAVLAQPVIALAQPTCDTRAAEALERDGQTANLRGRHEAALRLFERAYDLCHAPRALARIALTEAALGRWLDADRHLADALAARGDPWVQRNAQALDVEARRVGEHLGALLVTGEGAPATLFVDGQEAARWPMRSPVRLLPGVVTVTVRAEGYGTVERSVRVTSGETAREEITLVPIPPPEPAPTVASPTPPPVVERAVVAPAALNVTPPATVAPPRGEDRARGRSTLWVIGWVSGGVAVAGLATGAVAALVWQGAFSDTASARCDRGTTEAAFCAERGDTADGLRPWIYAGFALGSVMAVTSVLTFAFAPQSPRSGRAGLEWSCGVGVGSFGLSCGARF